MTPVLKLYLKVFLRMGIPFAVLMMLLNIGEDFRTLLSGFLYNALLFGGGMSLLLVTLHILRIRKDGVTTLDEGILRVAQKKEFPFHGSLQELTD